MTAAHVIIAIILIGSGVLHFVRPRAYASIVPPWLPSPRVLVLVSGVFEIAGGLGVLHPATRVAAGWGLIALLVAVFPANVQMLMNAHAAHASPAYQAALVARLPLQPLLVWWVFTAVVHGAP